MIQFKQGETVYIGKMEYVISDVSDSLIQLTNVSNDKVFLGLYPDEAQAFLRHAPYDIPDENPRPVFADGVNGMWAWSSQYGKVRLYSNNKNEDFPICVEHDGGKIGKFDLNGKAFSSSAEQDHPTLFPSLQACKEYWASVEV